MKTLLATLLLVSLAAPAAAGLVERPPGLSGDEWEFYEAMVLKGMHDPVSCFSYDGPGNPTVLYLRLVMSLEKKGLLKRWKTTTDKTCWIVIAPEVKEAMEKHFEFEDLFEPDSE